MSAIFMKDIEQCVEALNGGNLILYPTDTIWGIGCDATNENAVEKVFNLKQRSDKKTMIILVADEADILKYAITPGQGLIDYLHHSEKPTTVIYKYKNGLSDNLIAGDGTIAIRICRDFFSNTLIKAFGKPIVSTSANISGEKPPAMFSEISDEIKNGVDYIVQYRQDDTHPVVPSALIRWEKGQAVFLRK